MAATKEEILDAISNMSVMDVVDLVKMMEDKFGVTAAAPVVVAAAGPAAAAAPAEEQTEFTVVLAGIDAAKKVGVKPIQIYPSSPWENGYNERFNGTLRREILNAEWFSTVEQARTAIGIWLKQYNCIRPHQALGMRPPIPETLQEIGP